MLNVFKKLILVISSSEILKQLLKFFKNKLHEYQLLKFVLEFQGDIIPVQSLTHSSWNHIYYDIILELVKNLITRDQVCSVRYPTDSFLLYRLDKYSGQQHLQNNIKTYNHFFMRISTCKSWERHYWNEHHVFFP